MKKVVDKETVAHLWANKVQSEARNSSGNFYFRGDTIYSYGGHFPIAKHIEGGILMTYRTYSNTTAKHIGCVRMASSHLTKIYCYNPADLAVYNVERMVKDMYLELRGIEKARKPENYIRKASVYYEYIKAYCKAMKYRPVGDSAKKIKQFEKDYLTDNYKECVAKLKEKAVAAQKKLSALTDKAAILWKKNTPSEEYPKNIRDAYHTIMQSFGNNVLLRVVDGNVESTKGVKIPIPHAKMIVSAYYKGKLKPGDKIEWYTINEVTPTHIKAGCHTIPRKEIDYISHVV